MTPTDSKKDTARNKLESAVVKQLFKSIEKGIDLGKSDAKSFSYHTQPEFDAVMKAIDAYLTQVLKELKEEATPNQTTPAGEPEFVSIEAIDKKIKQLEELL